MSENNRDEKKKAAEEKTAKRKKKLEELKELRNRILYSKKIRDEKVRKILVFLAVVSTILGAVLIVSMQSSQFRGFRMYCNTIKPGKELNEIQAVADNFHYILEIHPDPAAAGFGERTIYTLRPDSAWAIKMGCQFISEAGVVTKVIR